MSLKLNGVDWAIKEQILEDPVTGLTFQFEVTPNGKQHLRIYGECLEYGNRDFVFDNGLNVGAGTSVSGVCKPAWLTDTEDL